MKTHLFFIAMVMSTGAMAQVTVDHTHIATLGDTVLMGEDTTHAAFLDLGEAGGDQLWDFSNLEEQKPDGIILEEPSTAPLYTLFPDADFVGNDPYEDSIHIFFKQTNSALDIVGIVEYDSAGNPMEGELSGTWRFMQFPASMDTTFTSELFTQVQTEYFGEDLDSAGPEPFIDSLRSKLTFTFYNEIDAWGEVKLPQGSFDCIRQKTVATIKASGDCYYNGGWHPYTTFMTQFIDSLYHDTATDGSFKWWSDDPAADLFIAQIDFDSLGNPDSNISYLLATPTPPVGIAGSPAGNVKVFPNPTSDMLRIQGLEGDWSVTILDIQAKVVLNKKSSQASMEIDLKSMDAGTYLVQVNDRSGKIIKLEKIQVY